MSNGDDGNEIQDPWQFPDPSFAPDTKGMERSPRGDNRLYMRDRHHLYVVT